MYSVAAAIVGLLSFSLFYFLFFYFFRKCWWQERKNEKQIINLLIVCSFVVVDYYKMIGHRTKKKLHGTGPGAHSRGEVIKNVACTDLFIYLLLFLYVE